MASFITLIPISDGNITIDLGLFYFFLFTPTFEENNLGVK